MNLLWDGYRFFEMILNERHLPAFLSGIATGIGVVWVFRRLMRGGKSVGLIAELRDQMAQMTLAREVSRGEIQGLRAEVESLFGHKALLEDQVKNRDGQVEVLKQQLEQTSSACERQATELFDLRNKVKLERKARRGVEKLANGYSNQLDDIANSDGKIWLRSANGHGVPFVPLPMRRAAILSVANLKGGVGKTTMTANLGASLAAEGLRVLLIDLDHQSSLTDLCLGVDEKEELKRSDHFIDDLFLDGGDLSTLNRCVARLRTPTGPGQLFLAPVKEEFADIENRLMTKWHSGLTPEDIRFRLRAALHSPRLRQYYDVVLIDCPPRLTTGSINALAASDYVMIPVLLEETSADGVPRILAWLKRFQAITCPDLNVLGVVGNKAFPRTKLIARERVIWNALRDKSQIAWGGPVHFFEEVIREHASVAGRFASLDPRHQPRYGNLVHQIRREIPHAHLQPSAVPPLAGAPAGGGGH